MGGRSKAVIDETEVRADLVEVMRYLAEEGQGVREMVRCIQSRLG
jgi:hypothetical protein